MWNPSKKVLFILMLIPAVVGGLSFSLIDWNVFETGKGILKEIQLPIILFALSIIFMLKYVKKLKIE